MIDRRLLRIETPQALCSLLHGNFFIEIYKSVPLVIPILHAGYGETVLESVIMFRLSRVQDR